MGDHYYFGQQSAFESIDSNDNGPNRCVSSLALLPVVPCPDAPVTETNFPLKKSII